MALDSNLKNSKGRKAKHIGEGANRGRRLLREGARVNNANKVPCDCQGLGDHLRFVIMTLKVRLSSEQMKMWYMYTQWITIQP